MNKEPEAYLTPGFSGYGNLLLTRNSDLDSTVHRIEIISLLIIVSTSYMQNKA